jgi:hypothetical protein
MRKYGESKTTRIMMATVPHVTSGSRLRKFQADGFLFDSVPKGVAHCFISLRKIGIVPTGKELLFERTGSCGSCLLVIRRFLLYQRTDCCIHKNTALSREYSYVLLASQQWVLFVPTPTSLVPKWILMRVSCVVKTVSICNLATITCSEVNPYEFLARQQ